MWSPGPKLYAASAARPGTATTKLHMDITDAVNVMTWSANPKEPGALWDIFAADCTEALKQFIQAEYGLVESKDPIHEQEFYLSDEMINRVVDQYHVRRWRVEQRVGDAIFIPAGCAHQVRQR